MGERGYTQSVHFITHRETLGERGKGEQEKFRGEKHQPHDGKGVGGLGELGGIEFLGVEQKR